MAKIQQLNTSSTSKTYSSYGRAEKAFMDLYENFDVRFIVVQLNEHNNNNPKHHGRYIPVGIGQRAMELGVHWNFHIIG